MEREAINPLSIYTVEDVQKIFDCGKNNAYYIMERAGAENLGGKKVLGINLIAYASGQVGTAREFVKRLADSIADKITNRQEVRD